MRAKLVRESLDEMIITDRDRYASQRDSDVPRYSSRKGREEEYYHIDKYGMKTRKTTKEMAREAKRQEAIKSLEQDGLVKVKFPATPEGVKELEDWAYQSSVDTDYVLRPIDLPSGGEEADLVVYDDEAGLGTKITDQLKQDYSAAQGSDYYNVSPISIGRWMDLDPLHKMRSRIEGRRKGKRERPDDVIGKMD